MHSYVPWKTITDGGVVVGWIVLIVAVIVVAGGVYWWLRKRGIVIPGIPSGATVPSAQEMLERIQALKQQQAQWPEIWASLNPQENTKVQQLLVEIRGPHLFAPHVGLNVIAEGCRQALRQNPQASGIQALEEALRSQGRITGAGN